MNNSFIDSYFDNNDLFFVFLLNRTEELKTTKKTQSYYCNKELFNKHLSNYQKWNKKGIDIYFSLNTFQKIENKISRKENYVKDIKTLFFDIDKNTETTLKTIIKELGIPTYKIQTSAYKYQLLYCFDNNININQKELKQIAQTLTYHFETDTTFDNARVARLPLMINNKNNFEVVYTKTNNTYTLEHFQKYIIANKLSITQEKEKKSFNHTKALAQSCQTFGTITPEINKTYVEKYNYFLLKNNNDFSAADMSFCVYLTKVKKLKNYKTIFKHFLNTCQNVEIRHKNLEEYFSNILSKI